MLPLRVNTTSEVLRQRVRAQSVNAEPAWDSKGLPCYGERWVHSGIEVSPT